jgi:hypothetical protein
MAKTPDRLYVDKADRALYDSIKEDVFEGRTRKEQFLLAMAFGFRYGGEGQSLKTKTEFFHAKDLHPEDEALLQAVALSHDSVDVLSDEGEVYRIAEEYAHTGIRLLHDEVTSGQHGSFYKRFEKDLFDIYNDLL